MSFSSPSSSIAEALDTAADSALARELHQTAQPLTALQGLLELALLSSCTAEEYRVVIERAMEQSQRIVDSFDQVRRLLHLSTPIERRLLSTDEIHGSESVHV